MSQLDDKINQHFAGLVVRKDLVKTVKGNAIVPTYVLEYLLGQYCATNDEATIQAGASAGTDDATRDGQVNIEDEWADLQVLIARCEAETIDLAGLDIRDPATFWTRQMRIEDGQRGGKGRLHAVVAAGFRSLEHWDEVSRYYQAKWSQLVRRDTGELEIRPREEFTGAALRARGLARTGGGGASRGGREQARAGTSRGRGPGPANTRTP
mgnify:CR=1 FL=1